MDLFSRFADWTMSENGTWFFAGILLGMMIESIKTKDD